MILALDIGSSSVKCAMLRGTRIVSELQAVDYPTRRDGETSGTAEIFPSDLLKAIGRAIHRVGPSARRADAIALSVMSPAWVAMDRRGRVLTPIVTHEDRRSVTQAMAIERCVGRARHLRLAGNRPFPGGISSTTFAWFNANHPALMRRAALVGHLNTMLLRLWTGARVIDPSNASFTGLYRTTTQDGWCDELMRAVGARVDQLPDILPANTIAGRLTRTAAAELHLTEGMPVLCGIMDGSAGMLLAGDRPGQLYHVSGSTDVLALCTDRPRPHARLLTRALGVGRRWTAVSTMASAGSTAAWAKATLFPEYDWPKFDRLIRRLGKSRLQAGVRFRPYLAGDRMSIEQPDAGFDHLRLASSRTEMLHAILESLIAASAQRIDVLRQQPVDFNPVVAASRSARSALERLLCRDWPSEWRFRGVKQVTLRGLGKLVPQPR